MPKPIKHLYKYQPINKNSLSCLANGEIWLSKKKSLNDPFDMIEPKYEYTDDQVETIIKEKCMGISDEVLSQDYLKMVKSMNDESLKVILKKNSDKMYDPMGVFSLSLLKEHILMWSHYADGHKGMCIEYQQDDCKPYVDDQGCFCLVKYHNVDDPLEIDLVKILFPSTVKGIREFLGGGKLNHESNVAEAIKVMMTTKSKDWRYENEWRFIAKNEENLASGGWTIPINEAGLKITGIIFGMKASDADKNLVKKTLGDDMKYSYARRKEGYFKLDILPL